MISRPAVWLATLLLTAPAILRAERLPIKTYTTAEGLVHNDVHRIVRDSRGFLWFCTAGGLSQFDGYTFRNFGTEHGLPHSSVNDLLETRGGEYWLATDGGLVRFDPKGRPDRHVSQDAGSTTERPMFAVVMPGDADARAPAVTVLLEGHDGTVWAGTRQGLFRLELSAGRRSLRAVDIRTPTEYPGQREIADLLEDAQGSLWMASPSGLYRRWRDGSTARYTTRDGLPRDDVWDLFQDRSGRLWAATHTGGFFRLRPGPDRETPVVDSQFGYRDGDEHGLPSPWVFQLFEASDGRFWVATARGLAEFLDMGDEHHRFRSYTKRNGLSYFDITAVNEDLGGNLWLGTNSAGVMKLTRGGFSTYGEQDGIETVNHVFEDRAGHLAFRGNVLGDVRTSVFEGAKLDVLRGDRPVFHPRLGQLKDQRFTWFTPSTVTNLGWVMEHVTLQARDGTWWVGTAEGLYRFPANPEITAVATAHPLAVYTTRDGLTAQQVFRLFEDSRGNIWISTIHPSANGLGRWDPRSGKIRDLTHAGGLPEFRDDRPRSFGEEPSGTLWFGFNNGLARYAHDTFTFFTPDEGLPPGAIMDIHVDRSGRLWLASARGGLVRVDDTRATRPRFVSYAMREGLSSDNAVALAEDLSGRIYVGGGHGIDRFDPATRRVKQFTTTDGYAPGTVGGAFRDRTGALWFAMSSGLARLEPEPDVPSPPAPPILITGLRVTNVPRLVSALGEPQLSLGDLAPQQNQLQIDFVGLGFGSGEVLRYQYLLEGADTDWSAPDEHRTVTYASLAPGRYRFTVRAVNSDGIVSAHPAAIDFTILSPLWLRWWALALIATTAGALSYAGYRYRVARLLELVHIRTRIATDLHDDVGANLTRIAVLAEVASHTHDVGPLASIARIARESVSSMSDIVWAINPKRDSLIDLTRRMRQHADELFTLRDIELRFSAPGGADNLRIGVDIRRDLLLIFKEAVNNAARHSRCSLVEIELRIEASRLVLAIIDNGIGFDSRSAADGQGLGSMQRRAQTLHGSLDITSRSGAGTTVRLDVPI